jgi:DedD protein
VRVRARRRLIGAAALLLAVAIVVPMTLDPEPKPTADNIAIDIPSEKTPFTPRLSLPPVPGPENAPVAPPADSASAPALAPNADIADEAPKAPLKPLENKKADEQQRARTLLEGKAAAKSAGAGAKAERFAVQAAAPASEAAARELAERLKKGGLTPYMEKVDTSQGARYRVRLGPYASRDEADGVRNRLKAQGISANLITL